MRTTREIELEIISRFGGKPMHEIPDEELNTGGLFTELLRSLDDDRTAMKLTNDLNLWNLKAKQWAREQIDAASKSAVDETIDRLLASRG